MFEIEMEIESHQVTMQTLSLGGSCFFMHPKNLRIDFVVGKMLKGGGTVEPVSK